MISAIPNIICAKYIYTLYLHCNDISIKRKYETSPNKVAAFQVHPSWFALLMWLLLAQFIFCVHTSVILYVAYICSEHGTRSWNVLWFHLWLCICACTALKCILIITGMNLRHHIHACGIFACAFVWPYIFIAHQYRVHMYIVLQLTSCTCRQKKNIQRIAFYWKGFIRSDDDVSWLSRTKVITSNRVCTLVRHNEQWLNVYIYINTEICRLWAVWVIAAGAVYN